MRYPAYRRPRKQCGIQRRFTFTRFDTKGDNTSILVFNANSDDTIPLDAQEETPIDKPSTLEKPLTEQAPEVYCEAASLNVVHAGSKLNIYQRRMLAQKCIVNVSIHKLVPTSL